MRKLGYIVPIFMLFFANAHAASQGAIDAANHSDARFLANHLCAGASQKKNYRQAKLKVIESAASVTVEYINPSTKDVDYRENAQGWRVVQVEADVWKEIVANIPIHDPKNPMAAIMGQPKCKPVVGNIFRDKVL